MQVAKDVALMQNTFSYMKAMRIFPTSDKLDNPGRAFYIRIIVFGLSTIMLLIAILSHVAVGVIRGTYINLGVDISIALSLVGCYIFNIFYSLHLEDAIKLYRMLSDFETYGKPYTFDATNKKMNKLSLLRILVLLVLVTGVSLSPMFEYKQCLKYYEGIDVEEICGIIGGAWLPFGLLGGVFKRVYCVYQVYAIFLIYFTADTINFSMLESVEHIIVRFHHVQATFLEVLKEKDPYLRRKRFGKAVEYHIAVIDLVKLLNKIFSSGTFTHVSLSAPLLGCIGNGVLESHSFSPISLSIGWINSLLTSCTSGQRLTNEGGSIGDAIYNSDWPDVDTKMQRDLVIVLRKCQVPIVLQGRPLATMNFAMIIKIINASYSYLTLIRQTK